MADAADVDALLLSALAALVALRWRPSLALDLKERSVLATSSIVVAEGAMRHGVPHGHRMSFDDL
jgi:hypothetical protein